MTHSYLGRIITQTDFRFKLRLKDASLSGTIEGTTLSGFSIQTTVGNTNTFLGMGNYTTQGKECHAAASGDDFFVRVKDEDIEDVWENGLKQITQTSNEPFVFKNKTYRTARGYRTKKTVVPKTGIILKHAVITKDNLSFLSKFISPTSLMPFMDRFIQRGSTTSSDTPPEVIRNSVYNDLLTAISGQGTADQFVNEYAQLPRREGKMSQRRQHEHDYKKEFVVTSNNPVEYNKVI